MIIVYLISQEQLGDRDFNSIPVAELQMEVEGMTPQEFQQKFNTGSLDCKKDFIRFVVR